MVIVQEIREDLLSDTEVGVVTAKASNGLGKGEADLRQARECGVFAELGGHDLGTFAPNDEVGRPRAAARLASQAQTDRSARGATTHASGPPPTGG